MKDGKSKKAVNKKQEKALAAKANLHNDPQSLNFIVRLNRTKYKLINALNSCYLI